jgi:hypothetical protein
LYNVDEVEELVFLFFRNDAKVEKGSKISSLPVRSRWGTRQRTTADGNRYLFYSSRQSNGKKNLVVLEQNAEASFLILNAAVKKRIEKRRGRTSQEERPWPWPWSINKYVTYV